MAKLGILAGATSQSVNVFIQDSSSASGAGLTGLVYNSAGLKAYYSHAGANATSNSISLATLATVTTAYASGGFKEIDATNMPGVYRLDLPNAVLAASKGRSVIVALTGATNMAPCVLEIELTAIDNQDAVRQGMTALPNAAAAASGGLQINGTNAGAVVYASMTVTGALTISAGLIITQSTTNGHGITATGNGTGAGLRVVGGATGVGLNAVGGSTSGDAILTSATSGHGATFAGTGTTKHGINATGGATSSHGISGTGGGTGAGMRLTAGATGPGLQISGGSTSGIGLAITTTSGDGISSLPTAGHGIIATGQGTAKAGMILTGSASGAGDGLQAVAGASGVAIRGNLEGSAKSIATGGITSGSFAAGAIDASAIAADAIGSSELAASAVTEIQSGLALAADLTTAQGDITTIKNAVDTEVAAIKAKTDNLPSDPASATAGVNVTSIAGSSGAATNLSIAAQSMLTASAITGTLSTTQMTTDLTEATDDHYKNRLVVFTSGALLRQVATIAAYDGTLKKITFANTLTDAPVNGGTFIIV